MTGYVSYLRVSTDRQGRSGLGLDAQRKAVADHLKGEPLIAEYVEVESGRRCERPKLREALLRARMEKACLLVAKLDRLSRNARFLLEIVESGADVTFCDLPQLPTGAIGKFILSIMAAVAELESGLVSERTKAALSVARGRGTVLGANGKKLAAKAREEAEARAMVIRDSFRQARDETLNFKDFVGWLNVHRVPTARGGQWTGTQARRVLQRIGPL